MTFEGADYTVFEIIWWMAASAILGFLIGWVLKRFFVTRRLTRELHAARNEITRLRERLDDGGDDDAESADGDADPDDEGDQEAEAEDRTEESEAVVNEGDDEPPDD